jgi:hypothetical protein
MEVLNHLVLAACHVSQPGCTIYRSRRVASAIWRWQEAVGGGAAACLAAVVAVAASLVAEVVAGAAGRLRTAAGRLRTHDEAPLVDKAMLQRSTTLSAVVAVAATAAAAP